LTISVHRKRLPRGERASRETNALSECQEAAVNIRKNMLRLRELRLTKKVADRATGSTAAKELPTKGTK
jgi:hypothetical protein